MILILLFYIDTSKKKGSGVSSFSGKQYALKCVDRLVFESSRERNLELAKFYDAVRAIVISDESDPQVTWGIERRPLKLKDCEKTLEQFQSVGDGVANDVAKAINHPTFKIQPNTSAKVYQSELIGSRAFVSPLHYGREIIFINGHVLGNINRTTFTTNEGVRLRPYVDAILKVIYGQGREITLSTYNKSRSTVQLSQIFGFEPRPLEEVLVFASQALNLLRNILLKADRLPSRVSESREFRVYGRGMRLDQRSMQFLARNPINLKTQRFGTVPEPKMVDIPKSRETHIIKENLQFLTVIKQLRSHLLRALQERDLRDTYAADLCDDLGNHTNRFVEKYNLQSAVVEICTPPRRYLTSKNPRLRSAGHLILDWSRLERTDLSGREKPRQRFIPLLDKLWEQFCLVRIVQALQEQGFKVDTSFGDDVTLSRGQTHVQIAYDREFSSGQRFGGLYFSKLTGGLRPDFTISVRSGAVYRVGILDAKFSPNEKNWPKRGEEIFEKYGAWFRALNGEPIDYVHAIVPSFDESFMRYGLAEPHQSAEPESLAFGYLAIQMAEHDTNCMRLLTDVMLGDLAFDSANLKVAS